jgi:hypothetical protein
MKLSSKPLNNKKLISKMRSIHESRDEKCTLKKIYTIPMGEKNTFYQLIGN